MTNLKINKVMTVEELLMPRIKCTTKFLGMKREGWEVGTICEVTKDTDDAVFILSLPNQYPLNFKPLNWWEERKVEDMPDYVKWDVGIYPTWKKIMKVDKWNSNGSFDHENVTISVINCFPATEQQYNDYINSNSNAKP